MANRYGWGDNEPKILPGTQNGDRINFFGIKIKALFTDLFAKLNVDANKLDGIQAGAEKNKNAFAKIKVGSSLILADNQEDTFEIVPGSNVIVTPDAINDKVTVGLPPSLDADITGSAATCNGCGETTPFQLTDGNAASEIKSGFYRTEDGVTTNGPAGRMHSAILQFFRGSTRGARFVAPIDATNTNKDIFLQKYNGTWGPLTRFVMQGEDITGSAAKLSPGAKINGVLFNGTQNITITAAANGGTSAACSGNAASATKLQTTRTINNVAFNGTQNITIPVQEYAAMSKTTAGYIKFKHSGIIFQWCRSSAINENSTTTVTFPIAFPSACTICVGGTAEHVNTSASQVAVTAWTKTNCTVKSGAGGNRQMRSATIIAIGY